MSACRRAIAALGGALGAGLALRSSRRWHRRLLDPVAPELRRSFLPFSAYVGAGPRTLALLRLPFRVQVQPQAGVAVTKHLIGPDSSVPVFVTTPVDAPAHAPALLFVHGGALIMGSPEFELKLLIAPLARALGAVVVAPKYRLAPEHPFPAAFDDCLATLRWMRASADELGIDADRIAVFGGSAGGGLAAALAQRCCDEAIPIRSQTLVYPMLDDRTVLRSEILRRRWMMNNPTTIRFGWAAYLGRVPSMSDTPPPYAVPARRADLSGLAPAWIGVGDIDLFHDEAVAYAERLTASGVQCELVTVPGMYHGADGLMPDVATMKDFRRRLLEHLRAHL